MYLCIFPGFIRVIVLIVLDILDYVLNGKHDDPTLPLDGTKAVWDPMLSSSDGIGKVYAGCWEDSEDEMRSSLMVANIFVERMIRTGSDRFYITAEDTDGCFCLYYHPSDKPDSQKMHPRFFLHSFTYFSLLCFRFNSCCEPTIPRQSKYYLKKSIRIR